MCALKLVVVCVFCVSMGVIVVDSLAIPALPVVPELAKHLPELHKHHPEENMNVVCTLVKYLGMKLC